MENTGEAMIDFADDIDNLTIGLSSHLEAHYNIRVTKLVCLETGVFRIDQAARSIWIARVFPRKSSYAITNTTYAAKILFFLQQCGFPAEKCAHEKPVSTFRGLEVLVTEFLHGYRPKICTETFRRLGDLLGQLHTLPFD